MCARNLIAWSTSVEVSAVKSRVRWVDHAKGICIFFVVMFHANEVAIEHHGGATGWLTHVVDFARPFRMPDFFLIAGLFLSASIGRPWRSYLDTKVVHFVYFYALWMTASFLMLDLPHRWIDTEDGAREIAQLYLLRYLDPHGSLWFIHILPIFFVLTRLTRAVPWPVMLGAAAVLHELRIDTGWHVPDELARRYVYFFAGYALAHHAFQLASWVQANPKLAIAGLAGWGVGNALLVELELATAPVVELGLGFVGAGAVIAAAALLSRHAWTEPLRYLGENSIVVYLGAGIASLVTIAVLDRVIGDVGTLALAATLTSILGCITLWRLVLHTPARFLYRRPRWLAIS
jgi:uncharacterized membrane protein YcfT